MSCELIPRKFSFVSELDNYQHGCSIKKVYRVKKDGQDFVLKMPRKSFDIDYLRNERKNLRIARDVPGITHLVSTCFHYDWRKCGIVKEYFPGRMLSQKDVTLPPHLKEDLEKTIHDLHALDLFGLDLFPKNIVVSDDETAVKLVDLDSARYYGTWWDRTKNISNDNGIDFREQLKAGDLRNLENL